MCKDIKLFNFTEGDDLLAGFSHFEGVLDLLEVYSQFMIHVDQIFITNYLT